jgi:hypothetical protein
MVGLGTLVTGVAPLAGGLLVGGMAGKSGPSVGDLRSLIQSDLDLLQRIPADQVVRRAAIKRMLAEHVEALLVAQEKSYEFRRKLGYFTQHWRDIVLFISTLLFIVVLWSAADHHRPVWLPLFIATIVMSVVTAISLVRGFLRSGRAITPEGGHHQRDRDRKS